MAYSKMYVVGTEHSTDADGYSGPEVEDLFHCARKPLSSWRSPLLTILRQWHLLSPFVSGVRLIVHRPWSDPIAYVSESDR